MIRLAAINVQKIKDLIDKLSVFSSLQSKAAEPSDRLSEISVCCLQFMQMARKDRIWKGYVFLTQNYTSMYYTSMYNFRIFALRL